MVLAEKTWRVILYHTSMSSFSRAGAGLYSGSSTSLHTQTLSIQALKERLHSLLRLLPCAMNSPVHEVVAPLLRSDGLLVGPTHPLYEAQGRVCADGVVLLVAWQEAKGGRRETTEHNNNTKHTHKFSSASLFKQTQKHGTLKTALISESMVRSTDGANVS